jgi:chromosome segregation ATPase
MDAVLDRLEALEVKVREALAELEQARRGREASEAKVQALQTELRSREQEFSALVADRERDGAELARLRAEREEVRTRVEGLLEEIARLEASVQPLGVPGVRE